MAKRKTRRPKKPRKKAGKHRFQKSYLFRVIAGLGLLIFLVVMVGVLTRHLISRKYPVAPVTQPRVAKIPKFEIYPKGELPPRKSVPPAIPPAVKKKPKIAIIIDDMGYDEGMAEKFLELDSVLTFSILPLSPYRKNIARAAHSKGFDVMLHLPMEPDEYPAIDPGPGVLLTSMSPDQLISQLNKDLDSVPFVKGVNNHMGSKMTAVSSQLYQIFSILKKRGLFFVDSRTTVNTLCKPSAHLLQISFAQKDVFIDHIQKPDFIRNQIHRLIQIAGKHGEAIGIAHPHSVTYEVLREMLPELREKASLVHVSDVVHVAG